MVVNKKFVDLSSGKVFEVIDQFEDIAILDNKLKVKVNNLLNKQLYEEYIDPNTFFRNDNLVNTFAQQIKQLPLDQIYKKKIEDIEPDSLYRPSMSDSAIIPYDPEEEKRELLEKARKMYQNSSRNTNNYEKFADLIDQDENIEITEIEPQIEPQRRPPINETEIQQPIIENTQYMDPILSMFRNVKRNTDFKINFEINNKIPRLDFIEMMEDSYNTSIIEFLAEEFTNQILINPDLIKTKISDEIRKMVYQNNESESSEEVTKPRVTKKSKQSDD
jgi:hypothetical protein